MPWAGRTPPTPAAGTPVRSLTAPAPLADSHASVPVSATLAVNDAIAARKRNGQPVLPLGFGEAGIPVLPLLAAELAAAASRGGYGPVAGSPELRAAAAGYWSRRGLPTTPDSVVAGPGSKALLFGLLIAIGSDVAVARPSWVSYAAQACSRSSSGPPPGTAASAIRTSSPAWCRRAAPPDARCGPSS
jgi:aspartate/methionine/tyrosine aminotransferase